MATMLPVLVAHGGAGTVPKDMEKAEIACAGLQAATRAGFSILQKGGSAMDAVVEAVTLLENNPSYNAGTTCGRAARDSSRCTGVLVHVCACVCMYLSVSPCFTAFPGTLLATLLLCHHGVMSDE